MDVAEKPTMTVMMDMSPNDLSNMLQAARNAAVGPPSIAGMRADMEAMGQAMQPVPGVQIQMTKLGSVDVLRANAKGSHQDKHLLYFHGGGYSAGSVQTHKAFVSYLADQTKLVVWSADYRLAPEHPFPAAVNDATEAYVGLLEKTGSARNIVIAGDSAGGGLAVACALKVKSQNAEQPAGLILLSPWCDLTSSGRSHVELGARDMVVSPEPLRLVRDAYLSGERQDHPLASPVFADLSGLPNMLIQVGSEEMLLSDSILLAEAAGRHRVAVDLEIWPKMPHVFPAYFQFSPDARRAVGKIADWLDERLSASELSQ